MFTHHLWEGELTPALFSELNQAGGRVWLLTCWWPTACCVVRKVNCLMFLLLSRNLTNEWSEFIIEKLGFWKAPLACELMKLGLSPFRGWGVTSQWKDKILMTGAQLCIRLWWLWKGKVEPWAQLKHRSSEEKPRFQALWITGRSRLPTHSNKSVGSINEKFPSKLWASFQQPFLGSSFLKMSKLHQVILASPWIHQKKSVRKGPVRWVPPGCQAPRDGKAVRSHLARILLQGWHLCWASRDEWELARQRPKELVDKGLLI